jgi:exodeoxyribonuclease VII small subunit
MADDPKKFDFTQAINQLEDINTWFQHEDFNLDEGLRKLKEGKELIKKCRTRLREVENEFVHIKQEFAEESKEEESGSLDTLSDGHRPDRSVVKEKTIEPEDVPF